MTDTTPVIRVNAATVIDTTRRAWLPSSMLSVPVASAASRVMLKLPRLLPDFLPGFSPRPMQANLLIAMNLWSQGSL